MVWAVIVVAAFVAGALNTLAAGGSFITLPVLVLVAGLPANEANATNRVAVLVQCLVAALIFARGKLGGGRVALRLAPIACAGALGGAWLASRIPAAPMQKIIGGALLLCLPMIVLRMRSTPAASSAPHPLLVGICALVVGVYGGFLQAGVGVFALLLATWAFRLSIIDANNAKVILVGALTAVALVLFVSVGQVRPVHAALLASGQAVGAVVGARLVIRRGEALIRWALAAAIVVSGLEMLGVLRIGRG